MICENSKCDWYGEDHEDDFGCGLIVDSWGNVSKELPGDPGGKYCVSTDGVRFEVTTDYPAPWSKLHWYLRDDPKARPNWNRINMNSYKPDKKMSKSD